MFIGDFWIINDRVYRIAAFDYWFNTGDIPCTDHHVVIVSDENLYTAKMNDSNVVTGAYVGSKMYTTYIVNARTTITSDFGETNILTHREYFANTVSGEIETAGAWYNSTIDLMNEQMVYGCKVYHNAQQGTTWAANMTIDMTQLPLFYLRRDLFLNLSEFWLRDVGNNKGFCLSGAYCTAGGSSNALGVRPAFALK
jgi:hypothetical protein